MKRTKFPSSKKIICWWSGGITSAVACKIAIDIFGRGKCQIIMIDTRNEDPDTYRFQKDCEKWFGIPIQVISAIPSEYGEKDYEFINVGYKYESIQNVWERHKSLNVATGAICSTQLKRRVREKWQERNVFDYQVFGFEFDKKEFNRALGLTINHPKAKGIYPLLMMGYTKDDCLKIIQDANIEIPRSYQMGFRNNNCLLTGCVQGGIGYWQKMRRDFPDKFDAMADMEHKLTELKGRPVTMLTDQSKQAKKSGNVLVFLKKHPKYPNLKCIDDMPECKVEPLFECNGFCGVNDLLPRTKSEKDINYEQPNFFK